MHHGTAIHFFPSLATARAGCHSIGFQQDPRSSRCAGLFPFRISASSCSRSSALNRTTYRFTEISFAAMIPSAVNSDDKSESPNPFAMVEAGD
jgi:hypothetical protein